MSRVWEGYTQDAITPKLVQHSNAWRWNMAKTNALTVAQGEGSTATDATSEAAKAAPPLTVSIFEDLTESLISAELVDTIFGTGCLEALGNAQAADKSDAAGYKQPELFKNFKATMVADKLLRFNGRIVVPLQFYWFGKLFTRALIEYVHLEKVHVGAKDTLAGLK
ncbi:hypothetical protein HK097_001741, partial [Rhizophlyctis rosea]